MCFLVHGRTVDDIASQSVDVERHVFLGDTSVHKMHSRSSCWKLGANPSVFQKGSFSRTCSMTSRSGKEQKDTQHVSLKRKKKLVVLHDSELVIGVSMVQDQKRPGNTTKTDHLTHLLTEDGANLAVRMVNKFVGSKHPVFECSAIPQTGVLMRREKGRGAGTHFENESENHLMLVNLVLACNPLGLFFSMWKKRIQNKMPVRIATSILKLNQQKVTVLVHHEPQVCAVGDPLAF